MKLYFFAAFVLLFASHANGAEVLSFVEEIDSKKAYRITDSNFSKDLLPDLQKKLNIKTFILLKEAEPKSFHSKRDMELPKISQGMEFYSVSIFPRGYLSGRSLFALINILEKAPRPLIFHSKKNVLTDRAVGIYLYDYVYQDPIWFQRAYLGFHVPILELLGIIDRRFLSNYRGKELARQYYNPCDNPRFYMGRAACSHDSK